MANEVVTDLNATITEAVQARVSAAVMEALSGDAVVGHFVTAALMEKQPKDRYDSRGQGPTFLDQTIKATFQEITKQVVADVLKEERETIRDEVRRSLKRRADGLADSIVTHLDESIKKSYGVQVTLRMPGND